MFCLCFVVDEVDVVLFIVVIWLGVGVVVVDIVVEYEFFIGVDGVVGKNVYV